MAVVMRQSIRFGGVDSSTYGIYISGEGVFDAPKRAVEMVSVPGRNGSIAIDQGYYENIEVTYPAFYVGSNLSTFASALASFRNAIASQKGYQRLTDSFHASEYRMAMFIDGLEIDPIKYNTAAQFELKFNCKPQRWLTSGESAQTIAASGRTITNPTLYDANPMLEVEGYGTLTVNGYEIEIDNATMGAVTLADSASYDVSSSEVLSLDTNLYNSGDTITVGSTTISLTIKASAPGSAVQSVTSSTPSGDGSVSYNFSSYRVYGTITLPSFSIASTSSQSVSESWALVLSVLVNGTTYSITYTVTATVSYADNEVTLTYATTRSDSAGRVGGGIPSYRLSGVTAESSVNILGAPTYVDCDLGVCYKVESGTVIDLNGYIDLGSDLPVLSSGSNTITYDNTVTSLKITPRWWQL